MVAVAGGKNIRCASYATFGTEALAQHAVAALEGRRACLLAHHGSIALGDLKGFVRPVFRKHDEKFLAAIARGEIHTSERLLEH